MRAEGVLGMILPKDRDPRFVTIRRGGTLTDSDHQLLALWAALCAEHVLDLFESARPLDPRPRRAARVPVAAQPAPGGDSRARTRRPAVAERHLLVGVRLLIGSRFPGAQPERRQANNTQESAKYSDHASGFLPLQVIEANIPG